MEDWLTTYQATKLSGYNSEYLRQLIRAEKVIGRKWGPYWQVNRQSLENYITKANQLGKRRGPKTRPNTK